MLTKLIDDGSNFDREINNEITVGGKFWSSKSCFLFLNEEAHFCKAHYGNWFDELSFKAISWESVVYKLIKQLNEMFN